MPRHGFCKIIMAALFALLATAWNLDGGEQAGNRQKESTTKVVRMVVDYGDGVQKHFTQIPYRSGMTVLDAMQYAQRHKRGIQATTRGSGPTAFLKAIDGLANEGNGRNWTYRVDGKLPDHSFAIHRLSAGATILWKFGRAI